MPHRATLVVVVLALDLSFYLAHVAMHKSELLWRIHRAHHSDPAVDVTTTIRQHPGEGVIRYAFTALFAIALGASPDAFAVYRMWSVLTGLLEHANIRLPLWLDGLLSLAVTSPNMHKVHHSRAAHQTDTNYGNTAQWRACTARGRGRHQPRINPPGDTRRVRHQHARRPRSTATGAVGYRILDTESKLIRACH